MADLPKERVTPAPPFTYCGINYFGPFVVKQGRKEVKRYGAVFTCMASRAVHIETAVSLETDSFINALRRFIARRGPVREIRSDQGTNLVGAEKELNLALKEMNHDEIQKSLVRITPVGLSLGNETPLLHLIWEVYGNDKYDQFVLF
jgi:hypothetical protein